MTNETLRTDNSKKKGGRLRAKGGGCAAVTGLLQPLSLLRLVPRVSRGPGTLAPPPTTLRRGLWRPLFPWRLLAYGAAIPGRLLRRSACNPKNRVRGLRHSYAIPAIRWRPQSARVTLASGVTDKPEVCSAS
jgi:hypothetical protein